MERMALLCPLLPTAVLLVSHSLTYSLTQTVNSRDGATGSRMSVFDHLMPQPSASSRQTGEPPSVSLSPPLSLSSPVIKKKAIQIPSFDEKGLIHEKYDTLQETTSRSFVPICPSKMSSQASLSLKSCQQSQKIHADRASTLPRTKPRTYDSLTFSEKPSIAILPASKPNSSPTLPTVKPKPSASHHLPTSQRSDLSPLLHQLQPKPSVSPTLTVPAPRLSPSPTSMCQGLEAASLQPSPVAKERRAKSITISNTKVEPHQSASNEAKQGVLDQEALLDFTRPERRSSRSSHLSESRYQTHSDSQKQAATSQDFGFLQEKVTLGKNESVSKDKQETPQRNLEFSASPKLKSNGKHPHECLPSGAASTQTFLSSGSDGIKSANVVHKDAQSLFDGTATHRKCSDYSQSRYNTQTAAFASNKKSFEQMYLERSTASKTSFSTGPLVSPITKTRRTLLYQHKDAKVDTTFPSCFNLRRRKEENHSHAAAGNSLQHSPTSPPEHRLWSKVQSQAAPTDTSSSESQSVCFPRDYGSQSRDIDRKAETSKRGDSGFRTCLVLPQMQEASRPDTASQKRLLQYERPPAWQSEEHKEVNVADKWLHQTDILAAADRHGALTEPRERPSEDCIVNRPLSFSPNSSGISLKGVFDSPSQPQRRHYHRPEEGTSVTASPSAKQVSCSLANRAFIMEQAEDPYYVTMYYPGSVYVGEYKYIQTT